MLFITHFTQCLFESIHRCVMVKILSAQPSFIILNAMHSNLNWNIVLFAIVIKRNDYIYRWWYIIIRIYAIYAIHFLKHSSADSVHTWALIRPSLRLHEVFGSARPLADEAMTTQNTNYSVCFQGELVSEFIRILMEWVIIGSGNIL